MKIKYIIFIFNSKRDVNGNKYYAFQMWNTHTGSTITGTIDDPRAPENAVWRAANNGAEILKFEQELNKREFKKKVKNYKHYLQREIPVDF